MNRMVLAIPCLRGTLTEAGIRTALTAVSHSDLRAWEEESVPETMEQFRRRAFSNADSRRPEWVPNVWAPT